MADEPHHEEDMRDARTRILDAASQLIASGGIAALTTRAVASAACVQAPTLYRLFGEKQGLLQAVAEHGLAAFVARKSAAEPHPDPVRDLSDAWDSYVTFGLTNPAVFAIMNEIGAPASASPATLAGIAVLRERVRRIARAGRLAVPVERAVALIHAVGVGTVSTLLALPVTARDPQLATTARDTVLAAVIVDVSVREQEVGIASLAVALGARLGDAGDLTPGERLLLSELFDRLSSGV